MKHVMTVVLAFWFACACVSSVVWAQGSAGTQSPIAGAWRVVETQDGPMTQPSLYIFTARHFSRMNVAGGKPRTPFKDPAKATNEEKVAAFDTFTANTGTYQLSGDGIVFDVAGQGAESSVLGTPRSCSRSRVRC